MSHRKTLLVTWITVILIVTLGSASAQESLMKRAELLEMEATRLAESGRDDDAAAARKTAVDLKLKAKQRERASRTAAEIAELGSVLGRLKSELQKGVSEEDARHLNRESQRIIREIEQRTADLPSLWGNDDRRVQDPDDDAHERDFGAREHEVDRREVQNGGNEKRDSDDLGFQLEHMHRAIEHLHASGLHEIAERVEEQSNTIEHELNVRRGQHFEAMMHGMMGRIDLLSRQVDDLRREVQRLKK